MPHALHRCLVEVRELCIIFPLYDYIHESYIYLKRNYFPMVHYQKCEEECKELARDIENKIFMVDQIADND